MEENRPLSHVNLTIVFETLTMCLAMACKIDEAIASNGHLRRSFQAMKVAIERSFSRGRRKGDEERKEKVTRFEENYGNVRI